MQTLSSTGGHGPRGRRCPEYCELGMAADVERGMVRRMDRPKIPHATSRRRLSTLQSAQVSPRRQNPRNKFPTFYRRSKRSGSSGCLRTVTCWHLNNRFCSDRQKFSTSLKVFDLCSSRSDEREAPTTLYCGRRCAVVLGGTLILGSGKVLQAWETDEEITLGPLVVVARLQQAVVSTVADIEPHQ
jgi:hypothetical protein